MEKGKHVSSYFAITVLIDSQLTALTLKGCFTQIRIEFR